MAVEKNSSEYNCTLIYLYIFDDKLVNLRMLIKTYRRSSTIGPAENLFQRIYIQEVYVFQNPYNKNQISVLPINFRTI